MRKVYDDIIIVIPSLEPTQVLITYVEQLIMHKFFHIIVVNDGSNQTFDRIFQELKRIHGCTVLAHEVNQGKGAALKTGYTYIKEHFPECKGIITADSDGQHAVEDVCNLAQELQKTKGTLLLGSRNFSLPSIPTKSKVGNRISSILFFCLYGKWIGDTQTGLRGFSTALLEEMIQIQGERFEYEMQVIISCVVKKIPMKQIEIRTIYENNNAGTHFQVYADSVRIAKVIFRNFFRFCSSSVASAVVDIGIAWFLLDFLKGYIVNHELLRIGVATGMARIISMLVNYSMNKILVFEDKKKNVGSFIRYIMLCVLIMSLSTLFVYGTYQGLGWNEKIAKVVGDSLLFFVSYQMQQLWVFDRKEGGKCV